MINRVREIIEAAEEVTGEAAEATAPLLLPSTAAEADNPRSCTSGFFTKFWLGEVP